MSTTRTRHCLVMLAVVVGLTSLAQLSSGPPTGTQADGAIALTRQEPALGEEETRLDSVFARAQAKARQWQYAWLGIFGGLVVAQSSIAAAIDDSDLRISQAFAAGPPAVGIIFSLVNPIRSLNAVDRSRELDALHPNDSHRRVLAKRRLLHELARNERQARGWFPRVAGWVLNLSAAGAIWALTDDPVPAAVQLGVGVVPNETKLQTGPRVLSQAEREAQATVLGGSHGESR